MLAGNAAAEYCISMGFLVVQDTQGRWADDYDWTCGDVQGVMTTG